MNNLDDAKKLIRWYENSPHHMTVLEALNYLLWMVENLQASLEQIKNNPNCRHEVEAQLGEEIWKPLKGN